MVLQSTKEAELFRIYGVLKPNICFCNFKASRTYTIICQSAVHISKEIKWQPDVMDTIASKADQCTGPVVSTVQFQKQSQWR